MGGECSRPEAGGRSQWEAREDPNLLNVLEPGRGGKWEMPATCLEFCSKADLRHDAQLLKHDERSPG